MFYNQHMARRVRPEDLSERELRRLLIEKKRVIRKKRLEAFRRSGRLVDLAPIPDTQTPTLLDDLELGQPEMPSEEQVRQNRRKKIMDRALLFVEVLAIVGLLFVLLNGVGIVQELNQQVAEALIQPTITPTPLIRAVVLPSGHTPPDATGGARFNDTEIPEHLRPLYQSYANLPIPTPSPEQAIRIQIPALGIDAPIVMGDGWEQLKQGVGQHIGSANPGQAGNMVVSGHNDIFGQLFRHLDQLEIGDEIIVFTNIRSYTYVVDKETEIVEPTYVQVMNPTSNPTLTLISCYPYLVNDKRIVVRASLVDR
jgi:sortase A